MLEHLTNAVLTVIEREIIKHAPEIQELLLQQLENVAHLLFDYVQTKLMGLVEEEKPEEKKVSLPE